MSKKNRKVLEIPTFDPEQEAETRLLAKAVRDVIAEFALSKMTIEAIGNLIDRLIREALWRANPNRRMAYLEQWSNFLSQLPEQMRQQSDSERSRFLIHCVKHFFLLDA